ncbi:hypothetical protein D3OALGA1CA_3447 [Olavius algarvensis associated proteobacterium Delta 3]|nr:hypothetical protein D3OALGA1CA_3447 [Olavius algarvensis associated proteobacterium Delta 3]CAB5162480.1 hypothetical protein D3OALGB2SA_5517 [Olavius algarvensis associated proteobacterium Delta 3]
MFMPDMEMIYLGVAIAAAAAYWWVVKKESKRNTRRLSERYPDLHQFLNDSRAKRIPTVTLKMGRARYLLILLMGAALIPYFWEDWYMDVFDRVELVFVGIAAVIILFAVFPKAGYLEITPKGLTVKSMYRKMRYAWSDFTHFQVGHYLGDKKILHQDDEVIQMFLSEQYFNQGRTLPSKKSKEFKPLVDHYGIDNETLARILNKALAVFNGQQTRAGLN